MKMLVVAEALHNHTAHRSLSWRQAPSGYGDARQRWSTHHLFGRSVMCA